MDGEDDGEAMPNAAFAGSHVPAHFDLPQQHYLAGPALQEVGAVLMQLHMPVGSHNVQPQRPLPCALAFWVVLAVMLQND